VEKISKEMTEYYADILITVIPDDINFMLNKIYQTLHGIISNSEQKIGIGFPDWYDYEVNVQRKIIKHGSIGNTIRLFGSINKLTSIINEPSLIHFTDTGCVRIYPIQQTPDTDSYVKFTRNRKKEKAGKHFVKRKKRRAENRGNIFSKSEKRHNKTIPSVNIYYFKMLSNENGHSFSLFIERKFCDFQGNGSFSNYGLCKGTMSLPHF